jgi:hypothetical protein
MTPKTPPIEANAPAQGAEAVLQSEFARMMGVNRSTVTRWKQQGRLVLDAQGLVLVDPSRMRIFETQGGRLDLVAQHAQDRGQEIPLLDPAAAFVLAAPSATPKPKAPAQSAAGTASAAQCDKDNTKPARKRQESPAAAQDAVAPSTPPPAAAPAAGAHSSGDTDATMTATRREHKLALLHAENQQMRLAMDLARGVRYYRHHVRDGALGLGGSIRALIERVIDQTAPQLAAAPSADRPRMIADAIRRLRQSVRWETVRALRQVQRKETKA